MIDTKEFFEEFKKNQVDFFTGVPDSLLKDICGYITDNTEASEHIIAANEGAAISLAAGYHLASAKLPLVYLQNSGLGNCVNPLLSLADQEVYSIPMLVMIGWRGEPGVKDEPQHRKQGRVQNELLKAMEIDFVEITKDTTNVSKVIKEASEKAMRDSKPVALVISKGTFQPYSLKTSENNNLAMNREEAIIQIVSQLDPSDVVVSTTGKASRELFETRVRNDQSKQSDFLTVGSMGHASQIALGIALNTNKKVYCLDGDGAVIMHMGSLAIIGNSDVSGFVHIVINNGAHDSVGGQPTVGFNINFTEIALNCGYEKSFSVETEEDLKEVLGSFDGAGKIFVEVKVNKGARKELGRPTSTPMENKIALMKFLN